MRPSRLGCWVGRTWQGSSHFSPRHPGAQVQVPSRVLQAPPLRHWQVKLQPKPHVPLGQLMEHSTPCQPATARTQKHMSKQGSREFPSEPFQASFHLQNLRQARQCPEAQHRAHWLCHVKSQSEMNKSTPTAMHAM